MAAPENNEGIESLDLRLERLRVGRLGSGIAAAM
jgi:hypothetical protein